MDLLFLLKTSLLLVAVIINLLLGVMVFTNNPKSATNRIFTLLSIVITIWLTVNYISLLPAFLLSSLIWIRLSIFFAVPMLALFILLAHTLPSNRFLLAKWQSTTLIVLTVIVMAVCISPYAFTSVEVVNSTPQPTPGPGIAVFGLAAATSLITAVYLLVRKLRRSSGIDKQKFRYISLGILAMISLLIGTVLVPVAVFKINFFVSFIPLYTIIFLGLTTYAIVRHRLFDIRTVVARSATYLLLLIALATIYALAFLAASRLFFSGTAPKDSLGQQIVYISLAVLLAFTFQPLRRFFEKNTSRVFYKFHYDPRNLH